MLSGTDFLGPLRVPLNGSILYSYLRLRGNLLDVFLLLLAEILSEPHGIQSTKNWTAEQTAKRKFRGTCNPICKFSSLFRQPHPPWRTFWMTSHFCRYHDIFFNKTGLSKKHRPFVYRKYSYSESFYKLPSKILMMEYF